jgi:hypothetical protein
MIERTEEQVRALSVGGPPPLLVDTQMGEAYDDSPWTREELESLASELLTAID